MDDVNYQFHRCKVIFVVFIGVGLWNNETRKQTFF